MTDGLFQLEVHGADTFVGTGPQYPWGGLYGGQIVAQALRAAAMTVDPAFVAHSLRAYFIRRGDHDEPIRFEVDRIRNGRSFLTRRVVARQAIGAILNLEASFQVPEASVDLTTVPMQHGLPLPDDLDDSSWSPTFARRMIPRSVTSLDLRPGAGRVAAWMKHTPAGGQPLGDDTLMHRCWLAFISDDLPTDAVAFALSPEGQERWDFGYAASLDHSIWFHRAPRSDHWHLHDFTCFGMASGRGLAVGQIYTIDGTHVATVAQEVLMRDRRDS